MIEIPEEIKITKIELLKADKQLPFKQQGNRVEFIIPEIIDFEVAALNKD